MLSNTGILQATRLAVVSALIVPLAAGSLAAQSLPVGDPLDDYARLLQLTGALPVSPVTARSTFLAEELIQGSLEAADPWRVANQGRFRPFADARSPQFRLLPADLRLAHNTARPWGTNDGALWQGRGSAIAVSAGAEARWGRFSAVVRPVAIRTENRAFALSPIAVPAGLSPFAYPTGIGQRIDMPQRFGDEAFTTFDLGPSFVRAEFGPVALGLSNESMWWGPGRRNDILMTNNAPGFGHVFLGTSRPADVRIGTLHTRWVWGRLRESAYFDADAENDSRFITGLVASFSPAGLSGLELGVSRVFVSEWEQGGPSLDEALAVFLPLQKKALVTPDNPNGDDRRDQIAALFFRWAMPASGFEFYGEWARGDHARDLRDLFVEPEHTSGYLVGFQKVFRRPAEVLWQLGSELTVLGSARTALLRPPASGFYVHHLIRQGYTQRGQVMGAGIGPGASQLWAGLARFAPWGKVGAGLQRTVYDNNRFYAEPRSHHTHEVEPSFTADVLVYRGRWDLSGSVSTSTLMNKHYIERNDERNLNLNLSARYHFGTR